MTVSPEEADAPHQMGIARAGVPVVLVGVPWFAPVGAVSVSSMRRSSHPG
jgi:hypothetical protein